MHIYHTVWKRALESHTDEAGRARLAAPKPWQKFVCFRHFKPGFSAVGVDPKEAIGSILAEFCGPKWIGDPNALPFPRAPKAPAVRLSIGPRPSISKLSSRRSPQQEHETGNPSVVASPTAKSSHEDDSFAASLDEKITSLVEQYGTNGAEHLRNYLVRQDIGRHLVREALYTFASEQVALSSSRGEAAFRSSVRCYTHVRSGNWMPIMLKYHLTLASPRAR